MVPWPAADTPTGPVQGQFAVASSVKAAARIAEFIIGVICEQRQLIQYPCVYLTALDNEQGSSFRVAGIGWIVMNVLLDRNKSRDICPGYPIARDLVFVDRPVPITIRASQRTGKGEFRLRLRLQL